MTEEGIRRAEASPPSSKDPSARGASAGGAALHAALRRQPWVITGVYASVAGAWIAFSDRALGALVRDPDALVELSVYKGFAFVLATAAVLYFGLRRWATAMKGGLDALRHEEAERSLLEEARRRADAIVESTDDAIVSETLDRRITTWNPAAERMFGYRAAEVIGRPIELVIPADHTEEAPTISSHVRQGARVVQFETLYTRKDGSTFPASVTVSPIRGCETRTGVPAVTGFSKIARDITERRKAEAIADQERRFASSLIEAMPGVFYLYDEERRFLRWNRNFEVVSGYSAEEVRKMHPLDLFPSGDRTLVEERIAEVFETGESSVEATFAAKNGDMIPYYFTGKRVDHDGATCLIGVGLDITTRKRALESLRKSEERYRTTLDSVLEGCQIIDFDWRYIYLNEAAASQNRRPNYELLGNRVADKWPGIEATPVYAMFEQAMRARIAQHDEIDFTFPSGEVGSFDVRVQPVPEGIFVLSIDISVRRQAEKALRDLNQHLELKVEERTRDLDLARERAEAADRIKSAFLATMSHELRTPLNSIIGFTAIVLQGLAGPLTAEQTKQLGMVRGSARHLLDLINDVLDISKIEAGQLEIRYASFDLGASVERVVASMMPLAAKKGLSLQAEMTEAVGTLSSDQRRVEQILLNLLNNAIKFTNRGGVTLSVDVVDADDRVDAGDPGPASAAGHAPPSGPGSQPRVRIQVVDTGIGMREQDLTQLFQPFRQIDSGIQRQHEGTGLGLAISHRLAELLGGRIRAQSTWGEGSTFTVVLPTNEARLP